MISEHQYSNYSLVNTCSNDLFPADLQPMSYMGAIEEGFKKVVKLSPDEFAFESSVRDLIGDVNLRIEDAKSGLNKVPILYNEETGEPIAVFKQYTSYWTTTNWGDLLAYRLDHDSFANVPFAFRLTSLPEKAPQKFLSGVFVKWISDTREMTASEQVYLISIQRQAISVLDMRLGNDDRNIGNVLLDSEERLIPIDHDRVFTQYKTYIGACFRDKPLHEKVREYILKLDIQQDIEILREFNVEANEVENFVIRTLFLKLAAEESLHSDLTIGEMEDLIEYLALPTGRLGKWIDHWLYTSPAKHFLKEQVEPYDENLLKKAFKELFDSYLSKIRTQLTSVTLKKVRELYC